jgi:hypothetical protein
MLSRPRPCPSGKERAQKKAPSPNSAKGLSKLGAGNGGRTGDPHVGKEMLGLISLRFFAQSGHIDAFRSIVGERCAPHFFRTSALLGHPSGTRMSWSTKRHVALRRQASALQMILLGAVWALCISLAWLFEMHQWHPAVW